MDVTPPAPAQRATWISSADELDRWLNSDAKSPLALDTEFERVSTFYPIPGLVQLGLGDQFRLVDPSVAQSSEQFRAMLADPHRRKLLYAMSEDLELFRHWLSLEPAGIVDLQIGAAMAGLGFSVGYARLVERLFGEVLDKSATRSDWLARPLTDEQERYATDDIRFLLPMYETIWGLLQQRGMIDAVVEESDRFTQDLAAQDQVEDHYRKLRGGWTLSRQQQGVLKALVQWREEECRKRDRPRNRVLADALLISIAESLPDNARELSSIKGVPSVVVRRYGDQLLDLIKVAANSDSSTIEVIQPPLPRQDQLLYKQIKRMMVEAAEARDVPVELLAPRKRLEAVVQNRDLSAGLFNSGWREAVIAPIRSRLEEALAA
ncbi:HRDC domain-containing protein [Marinobacter sp. CHS3-4]|uniref:ribonuclease D n=1 Tax=Marinobacter sp. CHS3-4 TaxID=3045174 RepID=UPI0024B5BA30|nr:HRDC domain-containing protein [Marinobacter sp. CHS3-4]MDI9245552.1 HRDC domain-containing protein [Marinobacter sp. CHS3-4]